MPSLAQRSRPQPRRTCREARRRKGFSGSRRTHSVMDRLDRGRPDRRRGLRPAMGAVTSPVLRQGANARLAPSNCAARASTPTTRRSGPRPDRRATTNESAPSNWSAKKLRTQPPLSTEGDRRERALERDKWCGGWWRMLARRGYAQAHGVRRGAAANSRPSVPTPATCPPTDRSPLVGDVHARDGQHGDRLRTFRRHAPCFPRPERKRFSSRVANWVRAQLSRS